MSATILTQSREAGEQVLSAITQAQDATVETVSAFVATLPEGVSVPAAPADVPSVPEISATYFDFAQSVLANQRAFADRLIAAGTVAGS
jgi:hypothetical protein